MRLSKKNLKDVAWRNVTEMIENVNHEKKENSQQQNVSEGVGNSNTLKIMPTASVDTIQDVKSEEKEQWNQNTQDSKEEQ